MADHLANLLALAASQSRTTLSGPAVARAAAIEQVENLALVRLPLVQQALVQRIPETHRFIMAARRQGLAVRGELNVGNPRLMGLAPLSGQEMVSRGRIAGV